MRGRKCKEDSFSETISFKITKEQKKLIKENKEIRENLKEDIRRYLNVFINIH